MQELGIFVKTFFANISIMLLLMYLASLVYKYLIYKLTPGWKEALFVVLVILGGWASMQYGFRFSSGTLFDLRFMTIIIAPMFVRHQASIIVIGAGVALARLTFGLNEAAVVGSINMLVMSAACYFVVREAARRRFGFYKKMVTVIFSVNTINVIFIALFGVIPMEHYLWRIAPGSYILSVILSFMFVLILREFIMEANRKQELLLYNERLEEQHRLAEKRTAELQAAKIELERKNELVMLASRYKSEFLANMSHEVRTPLNSMLVLAQLLQDNSDGNLSEGEVRYASIIHSSGEDLLKLISDVLDMSKIEAGHMEVNREEFSVSELLQHFKYTFGPVALKKNINLTVKREFGVPEFLYTDVQRVRQILNNMLSNAVKFTAFGSIQLVVYKAVEVEEAGSGEVRPGDWLAFSVQDTGIGVPKDKHSLIFEAFQQLDGSTSRTYGGTGLGLSISKQFAELLGGVIGLESEKGRGSRFTLYLPWKEAAAV
ncbi:sensor histidine kinase [Paenibacillus nasutitermitis]|uniref:Circadian input-output histidine kinase CikA n=1 Tax=Paenibacillus nasutitermitis TaxID=1652958 RepID=A0A916ZB59_9BACL|nr:ATP-binding protein [Paenibacillus nasutitermitis]GGD85572.1 hypothetical protein GCM10010911_49960 [Paenibacillus nasutitermitis]